MQQNFPVAPTSNILPLIVANVEIRQDAAGRFCLNDLHRASGSETRHKPGNWLMLKQTTELIDELSKAGIPAIESKQGLGTFASKDLVYDYAMWISAAFKVKVIRTFDAVVTGQYQQPAVDPMAILNDPSAMRGLLLTYSEKVLTLEHKVDELQPKAQALERLSGADGCFSIRDAAKAVKMAERKFIEWLQVSMRWLYRDQKGRLRGRSEVTPKYVYHRVTPIPTEEDSDRVAMQPLITAIGLTRLAEILNVEIETGVMA